MYRKKNSFIFRIYLQVTTKKRANDVAAIRLTVN